MCSSTEVSAVADEISIGLSHDQALVLFEWLARTGASDQPAEFEDQAEQRERVMGPSRRCRPEGDGHGRGGDPVRFRSSAQCNLEQDERRQRDS